DLFILHCDGGDEQYVAALHKNTGKLAWKTPRSVTYGFFIIGHMRKSFSTPLVIEADGKDQLISAATRRLYSYDPQTGKELWYVDTDGMSYSVAPVPVYGDGMIYVCTGYNKAELWGIRAEKAVGDATAEHVAWKFKQGVPFKPSPILVDGMIYLVNDSGIGRCIDAKTGRQIWQSRIGAANSASPL